MAVANFDEQQYRNIIRDVVSQEGLIEEAVGRLSERNIERLFFVGAGGAGMLLEPAYRIIQTASRIPCALEIPAEVAEVPHPGLDSSAAVVIASLSGTTSETLEVVQLARERQAFVIGLVADTDTPIAKQVDFVLPSSATDDTQAEVFQIQSIMLALAVMSERGDFDDYPDTRTQLRLLPDVLASVKRQFDPTAESLARSLANFDYHIVTSAGLSWAQARYMGMCLLEEAQWMRSRPVHASDFLHGTLELIERGVSVVVLKGCGAGRSLTDRVESFACRVTDQVVAIDVEKLPTDPLPRSTLTMVAPIILAATTERLLANLEVVRRHPRQIRRYYRRLTY